MLVTRPEPDAADTVARLAAIAIEAVACPLLTFECLPTNLPEPRGFAAMALTSANALRALEQRGQLAGFRHLRVFTVGDRTAERARDYGCTDVTSAGGALGDLVDLLAHQGIAGPVFYPAGRELGRLASRWRPSASWSSPHRCPCHDPGHGPADIRDQLVDGASARRSSTRATAETFVRPPPAASAARPGRGWHALPAGRWRRSSTPISSASRLPTIRARRR